MKGFWIVIVCALIICAGGLLAHPAVQPAAPATASRPVAFVPAAATAAATAPMSVAAKTPTLAEQPQGMNFFERRRYGLTIRKLRPLVEEVIAEGEIDREDQTALAAAVLAKHIQDNPGMFDEPQGINWDQLLEFIERLIPLILRIIDLFT